jgi:hypothetical protein
MNDGSRFFTGRNGFSAADLARADTWMCEICRTARGEMRGGAGEWRFGANQALMLRESGWFFDFVAYKGGHGAIALFAHFHGGDEAGQAAARAWLAKHPGDGQLGRSSGDEEDGDQSADDVERIACQTAVTPRAGTLAEGAKDINDLLRIDVELARLQLEQAASPQAMLHPGEKEALLDEVSRASTDVYENGRRAIADALNWRTGVLDDDRKWRRQDRAKQGDPVTQDIEIKPWPDPITDIGAILDEAVREVKRFLVVPTSAYFDAIALWAAHTHLVHRKELGVEYTPRCGFQSPVHECGKSTGLKCVHLMSHNPRAAASISASAMFSGGRRIRRLLDGRGGRPSVQGGQPRPAGDHERGRRRDARQGDAQRED